MAVVDEQDDRFDTPLFRPAAPPSRLESLATPRRTVLDLVGWELAWAAGVLMVAAIGAMPVRNTTGSLMAIMHPGSPDQVDHPAR